MKYILSATYLLLSGALALAQSPPRQHTHDPGRDPRPGATFAVEGTVTEVTPHFIPDLELCPGAPALANVRVKVDVGESVWGSGPDEVTAMCYFSGAGDETPCDCYELLSPGVEVRLYGDIHSSKNRAGLSWLQVHAVSVSP